MRKVRQSLVSLAYLSARCRGHVPRVHLSDEVCLGLPNVGFPDSKKEGGAETGADGGGQKPSLRDRSLTLLGLDRVTTSLEDTREPAS